MRGNITAMHDACVGIPQPHVALTLIRAAAGEALFDKSGLAFHFGPVLLFQIVQIVFLLSTGNY